MKKEGISKKVLTAVPIVNSLPNRMRTGVGCCKNGELVVILTDSTHMEQDVHELSERAFPNEGAILPGRGALWFSMFLRHVSPSTDNMTDDYSL